MHAWVILTVATLFPTNFNDTPVIPKPKILDTKEIYVYVYIYTQVPSPKDYY